VRLDPFRIQLLTISLDSQIVLAMIGVTAASILFRQAARQEGVDFSAGDWWDLVFGAVIGGRLIWVITHAEYYLRQPLQAVVVLDGGLHPAGLVLGAAYWVWRHGRSADGPCWRTVADLVAVGALTALLFERVGCALTTCGTGPVSELPGAILRGAEWRAPMALLQVIILAVALIIAAQRLAARGAAFITTLAALAAVEAVAFSAGRPVLASVAALSILAAIYAASARYSMAAMRPAATGGAQRGPANAGRPPPWEADQERT